MAERSPPLCLAYTRCRTAFRFVLRSLGGSVAKLGSLRSRAACFRYLFPRIRRGYSGVAARAVIATGGDWPPGSPSRFGGREWVGSVSLHTHKPARIL